MCTLKRNKVTVHVLTYLQYKKVYWLTFYTWHELAFIVLLCCAGTDVGTIVETVTATDADDGASLRYSINQSSIEATAPQDQPITDRAVFDYLVSMREFLADACTCSYYKKYVTTCTCTCTSHFCISAVPFLRHTKQPWNCIFRLSLFIDGCTRVSTVLSHWMSSRVLFCTC